MRIKSNLFGSGLSRLGNTDLSGAWLLGTRAEGTIKIGDTVDGYVPLASISYLSNLEKWDKLEIEKRYDLIAERFLKIWSFPIITIEEETERNEINIFEAEDPKYKKLEYAVFFDQKMEVNQVAKLYVEVIKQLFELQPETFFTTDLRSRISLTKNPDEANLRQPVPLNDTYYFETNIDNNGKFDRIKQALTIFGFEDELSIKYA